MIINYRALPDGSAVNVLPVSDSNLFRFHSDWKERQSYYCSGLEYNMLISPCLLSADELLLQRPGLYLKTHLPLGGIFYFPSLPIGYNESRFADETSWLAESYLFKYNSTRAPSKAPTPRLYLDYANNYPSHGPNVFDNARVYANQSARSLITLLNNKYSDDLWSFIESHQEFIKITNYAQTSLIEEACSHETFRRETNAYLNALKENDLSQLSKSSLTGGFEAIVCNKLYNRTLLSFYLSSIKEPFPNSPGSYIGIFKNLYNILEYFMENDGVSALASVLEKRLGCDRLKNIICSIKSSSDPQSSIHNVLVNGEKLSPGKTLPPLSETDSALVQKISERIYLKRNSALHSKKIYRSKPVDYLIRPGFYESFQLGADIEITRRICEAIIEDADPSE